MDQRVPLPVPSEDEYDAAYDQEISYGDVHPLEDIRTMGPMEQIDPFKRATRKRDYNYLSVSKDTQSQELVEQFEFVQKATKKRDHRFLSAPNP